jgi:[protein-PII] uridylyltransferase
MEVVAQDRPGLLLAVAKALLSCKIRLVTAKVATFGEKAEDIFYITDRDGQPINDPDLQSRLADQIKTSLPSFHGRA